MAFDLEVFNKQTYAVMTEVIDQEVEKFNAASGGAIVLENKPHEGDFDIKASFKAIANLVRRRNIYGTGAIPRTTLTMLKDVAVKIAAGTPVVEWEPAQYRWVLQNPELAALTIGEQLAVGRIGDMLNAALSGGVTAVSGNTNVVHTATGKATFKELNKGSAKFGDRSTDLKAFVMHSTTAHDLYDNALTNAERLFSYKTVNVMRDGFDRLFIITDSPALTQTTTGATPVTTYNTLGLVEGGIVVADNNDFDAVVINKEGDENIRRAYQAEWSYTVGVKGYAWDTAAGGKSPNDTALGTSSNWTKIATSDKDTAGVLVVTQ